MTYFTSIYFITAIVKFREPVGTELIYLFRLFLFRPDIVILIRSGLLFALLPVERGCIDRVPAGSVLGPGMSRGGEYSFNSSLNEWMQLQ